MIVERQRPCHRMSHDIPRAYSHEIAVNTAIVFLGMHGRLEIAVLVCVGLAINTSD